MKKHYDDAARLIDKLLWRCPEGFYDTGIAAGTVDPNKVRRASPQIFNPENFSPDTGDENVTDKTMRHNAGKPELSYILEFEDALDEVAKVCMAGAKKYARGNWKKGGENVTLESLMDSAMRHAKARMKGEKFDQELQVRHLAQFVWNGLAALYWELKEETFALNALDQDGEAKD